jgi:hypothetical protein
MPLAIASLRQSPKVSATGAPISRARSFEPTEQALAYVESAGAKGTVVVTMR